MHWKQIHSFFTKQRYWPWQIDLMKGADTDEFKEARTAASGHEVGALPSLRYTEKNPEWVLLYGHAQTGQIRPEDIRRMLRRDLEYLAGMNSSPPGVTGAKAAKLRENVARASLELNRRNQLRTAVTAGIIGAVIGAGATLLSK